MSSASVTAQSRPVPGMREPVPPQDKALASERFAFLPMALIGLLASFVLVPPVRSNPHLLWSFVGISAALLIWQLILRAIASRRGLAFRAEFFAIKAHYVQAGAQICIMAYWGWFARDVFAELPLIVAQLVFLYAFDGLLSWSLGRTWRLGFGPLPIIFSTNLLLWFKDDWFFLQFLMVAAGALGKQFIMWNRDGRRAHIFNPSSFGQFIFAIVLIATASTNDLTFGSQIAATFEVPHMLIVIFLVGLVVQYLFQVTLMTLAAAATLVLVNLIYTHFTGTYFFVNISIAAPIFLGIHLLITDPSTSPKTNTGRVIFGVLYALGYTVLFRVLDLAEVPLFWDKLLPVPILNLGVPVFDRIARMGFIGKVNERWQTALPAHQMNLVHMGCWIALFGAMLATGFVESPHPGDSVLFWKQAVADGKPHAGHSLVMATGSLAEGAGFAEAYTELGLICIEGKIVNENHGTAARYFGQGCQMGDINGCANVALQYLFLGERRNDADVALALDRLENDCPDQRSEMSCFLIGYAYETGRGRPMMKQKALAYYERGGLSNIYASRGIARLVAGGFAPQYDLSRIIPVLEYASMQGDDESCWYLAYIYANGLSVERNEAKAVAMLNKACELGLPDACAALQQPTLPPFANPIVNVPDWASAFPLP